MHLQRSVSYLKAGFESSSVTCTGNAAATSAPFFSTLKLYQETCCRQAVIATLVSVLYAEYMLSSVK